VKTKVWMMNGYGDAGSDDDDDDDFEADINDHSYAYPL
jgi:hypothetical protein